MSLDFELMLSLAVIVSGCIWAIDAVFWAKDRKKLSSTVDGSLSDEPILVEYARSFFPCPVSRFGATFLHF